MCQLMKDSSKSDPYYRNERGLKQFLSMANGTANNMIIKNGVICGFSGSTPKTLPAKQMCVNVQIDSIPMDLLADGQSGLIIERQFDR